jgi:PadR family transcriptional regulator PadR
MTAKSDLPQGTLDLLIMTVAALGPVHGYAIAQRLQQVSRDVVQVPQGSLYPALHRLENRGCWLPIGRPPRPGVKPNSIA